MDGSNRLATLIAQVLNQELSAQYHISQIDIPTVQGEDVLWSFLFGADEKDINNFPSLPPTDLQKGELYGIAGTDVCFAALDDHVCERIDPTSLLGSAAGASIPNYGRSLLSNPSGKRPFLFFRSLLGCSVISADFLARQLAQDTWYGSRVLPERLRQCSVGIEVGAQKVRLTTSNDKAIAYFEAGATYACFLAPGSKGKVVFRIFGEDGRIGHQSISQETFLLASGYQLDNLSGYKFVVPLEFDVIAPSSDLSQVHIEQALRRAPRQQRRKICAAVTKAFDVAVSEYTSRLSSRQGALSKRNKLEVEGECLGYEPTNEHEVIILTAKLEKRIASVLGVFQILEHTSQIDIDALVRIKWDPKVLTKPAATLEFEYCLESFFQHGHPVYITEFIVCWTVGRLSDGKYRYGLNGLAEKGAHLVEVTSDGWMKVLNFGTHTIRVLPLKQFPGLKLL